MRAWRGSRNGGGAGVIRPRSLALAPAPLERGHLAAAPWRERIPRRTRAREPNRHAGTGLLISETTVRRHPPPPPTQGCGRGFG